MSDLHDLIRQYGAYAKIPPAGWQSYYQALTEWKLRRGIGAIDNYDHGNQVAFVPKD
jgi:hypothetical protein